MEMQNPHHRADGRFETPGAPPVARMLDALKWSFRSRGSQRGFWPRWIEITPRPLPPRPPIGSSEVVATWIGHSTFLLQTASANILCDPVFSRCCGPFGRFGPQRTHAPGIALAALPKIDVVLLSHDHYDHCDLQSLRFLARRDSPIGITPLGNGVLLRRGGFARERILELDWWQTHALPRFANTLAHGAAPSSPPDARSAPSDSLAGPSAPAPTITLTPSQHWSKRLSSGRNTRLWGGFHITLSSASAKASAPAESAAPRRIYFAGDTGYHPTIFRDIAARLGPPDFAMLPIGAYEPRWFMTPQHCNPAEAVQIHRDLEARQSVAMHWGTFRLTDEARDEPPRALAAALREAGLASEVFKVLEPGESVTV